jgi:hypothetical protein
LAATYHRPYAQEEEAVLALGGSGQRRREIGEEGPALPESYYLDESDPDILVLRRQDDSFVAAFSASGATREGIVQAAKEDYEALLARLPKKEKRMG